MKSLSYVYNIGHGDIKVLQTYLSVIQILNCGGQQGTSERSSCTIKKRRRRPLPPQQHYGRAASLTVLMWMLSH